MEIIISFSLSLKINTLPNINELALNLVLVYSPLFAIFCSIIIHCIIKRSRVSIMNCETQ